MQFKQRLTTPGKHALTVHTGEEFHSTVCCGLDNADRLNLVW